MAPWFQWLGSLGFLLIEVSYVPQILRLYQMKEAEEFSLFFPSANLAGRICAITYSLAKGDAVFVGGLAVGITLRVVLLSQVIWYRTRRSQMNRLQEEAITI